MVIPGTKEQYLRTAMGGQRAKFNMPEPRFDQIGHPVFQGKGLMYLCLHAYRVSQGGTQPNLAQSPWDEVAQMATLRIIIARMNTHTHQGDNVHVLHRMR